MGARGVSWDKVVAAPSRMAKVGQLDEGRMPIGMKRVSPARQDQQLDALMGSVANGSVPITSDPRLADIVGRTLERKYGQVTK